MTASLTMSINAQESGIRPLRGLNCFSHIPESQNCGAEEARLLFCNPLFSARYDERTSGIRHLPSVDAPHTWRDDFQQMSVGVAEVEGFSAVLPFPSGFNRDPLLPKPCFPGSQF